MHQLWVLRMQTMNKLRAAAYCRVSTDRAEQSGSLASQRSFFDDYIRNSDSMTLVGVFYDATVIIGLKQNPTHGRRFSPVFFA